jgi:hypothetical protein
VSRRVPLSRRGARARPAGTFPATRPPPCCGRAPPAARVRQPLALAPDPDSRLGLRAPRQRPRPHSPRKRAPPPPVPLPPPGPAWWSPSRPPFPALPLTAAPGWAGAPGRPETALCRRAAAKRAWLSELKWERNSLQLHFAFYI